MTDRRPTGRPRPAEDGQGGWRWSAEARFLAVSLLVLGAALVAYRVAGDAVVALIVRGRPREPSFYQSKADILFKQYFIYTWAFAVWLRAVVALVRDRPRPPAWLLVSYTALLVATVFLVSPFNSYFSYHSLIHRSIVNNILAGRFPPENPFLAGVGLYYPWGFDALAAFVVGATRVDASTAFVLLNLLMVPACFAGAYGVSRLLRPDARANAMSAVCAFGGVAVIPPVLIATLYGATGLDIEVRGIPFVRKFLEVDGDPLGLASVLLTASMVILALGPERRPRHLAGLFVGLVACALAYPAMLPALAGAVVAATLAALAVGWRYERLVVVRRTAWVALSCLAAALVSLPFLLSISGSMDAGAITLAGVDGRLASLALWAGPVVLFIAVASRFAPPGLDPPRLRLVWSMVAAASTVYLGTSMPVQTEYKSLVVAVVLVMIVAGQVIGRLREWGPRVATACLILFVLPVYVYPIWTLRARASAPDAWLVTPEAYCTEGGNGQLHAWAARSTDPTAVFVDSDLSIPPCAGRSLFVATDKKWAAPGFTLKFLDAICRYPPTLLMTRRRLSDEAQAGGQAAAVLSAVDRELGQPRPLYVVRRTAEGARCATAGSGWRQVFRSTDGSVCVDVPDRGHAGLLSTNGGARGPLAPR